MSGAAPAEVILNVDDMEAIRYAKSRALRRAGYTVVEAGTGSEALAKMPQLRPALALLDVKLPDMSGLDVCKAIKRDYPGTLVLQTSASFVDSPHRVLGLDSGADSYLTEPVEPAELVAAVRALLRLGAAEEALRRLNTTLEQRVEERTRELSEAYARLRAESEERQRVEAALRQSQKMEAIGQLTGGIAHDFNNLLTGIIGGLGLLKRRLKQGRLEEMDRYADAAIASATRAAALTQRLLAFARRQPLDPKPMDMNRMVRSMEDLIRRTLGPTIQLALELDDAAWPILCDGNQLESALLNLVINARDAMADGGRLTIVSRNLSLMPDHTVAGQEIRGGDYLMLSVTDTGTGMSPDVVARAFDPFFTTKPTGKGTGLGLSQLYGFVHQSGGHARILSELGQGTTVSICLPRHHGLAQVGDADRAEVSTPAHSAQGGATVLVIEDEPVVRMLLVETLRELGCTVIEAATGREALGTLRSGHKLDLLITDLGLPGGLGGLEVAAIARENRPELKVLLITGYAESVAQGTSPLARGMTLVTKPFTLASLSDNIRALLVPES